MDRKIAGIHEKHIEIFLSRIAEDMYGEQLSLAAEVGVSREPVPYSDRLSLEFRPVREGEQWGGAWDSAWFHLTGRIPAEWAGKELALIIHMTGESLLFDGQGVPCFGFTGGTVFANDYTKERMIWGIARGGEQLDFWVEAAANYLYGLVMDRDPRLDTPHPQGSMEAFAHKMRMVVFNRQVWQLILDMKILQEIMLTLPEEDYRRHQILHALSRAVQVYQDDAGHAEAARGELQELLTRPAAASALTAYAVGHAHIDVGWLWPVRESIRKAARTYASQLRLLKDYPDYVFGGSQPQLYQFVKEHYPELFARIREQVKAGRWELQGGMWVEADCNLISGESMVRQFLHGKNFFMDEFGVEVRNLWLPDVFGYSGAMPQIIRKAGCDYFLTQKLSWSQVNDFPHDTFWWEGIDGTEVLTHFPPEKNYNAFVSPAALIRAQNQFKENGFLDKFISLFGLGDGGGGPMEDHLERLNRLKNLEYTPKMVCSRADEFFRKLSEDSGKLARWTGELYLEFHRGTYTSQARTKRWNRKNEQKLSAGEFLLSHLPLEKYPADELDQCWKKLLCNQFHDIIPGSSIHEVYEVTEREEAEISACCDRMMETAAAELFTPEANSAVLVNTLSCPYRGAVLLPQDWSHYLIFDEENRELPVQNISGEPAVLLDMPGNFFRTLYRGGRMSPVAGSVENDSLILENDLVRYEFNAAGRLLSAFLKQEQREMTDGPGNVLSIYYDRPNTYEAWDVDIFYRQEKKLDLNAVRAVKIADGPVAVILEFTYELEKSKLTQQVVLEKNSTRLDFRTTVDWHEDRRLLRVAFPVAVRTSEARYDIQYGFIRRPVHDNTSWDEARFEAVGHRYADLSCDQFGAALLNDCKYGYRVKDNTLDLALLRAPKYPDFEADMGRHEFTYAFYPHAGGVVDSALLQEAASLNRPPLVFAGYGNSSAVPFCHLEGEGLSLEVLKKAEKEPCRIVRLVETAGRISRGTLVFARQPARIIETSLMEWENQQECAAKEGRFFLTLKPFEIRTFKIW